MFTVKRPLCWIGLHAWKPETFTWNGGHGTGRVCTRCDHYELQTETWTRTEETS